jgi:hypothetical protein
MGVGSAFACTNVARDETRPLKTRLMQCGAITLVCWILFLLVVSGCRVAGALRLTANSVR